LLMYCVADNIRVGAATNAYNILKKLINQEWKNER
jgi:aspartate-semialdehyde dehydrogenase